MALACCVGLLLYLAGCSAPSAAPTPTPPVLSAWGPVIFLAEAPQAQAPALWPTSDGFAAAWVGLDTIGIHHEMRRFRGELLDMTRLTVPPVRPYAQQIAPAANGNLHLLWLDAASVIGGQTSGDETRLFAAIMTPSFTLNRGPTLISDLLTLRYSAVPGGDGGVWVVWSGGLPAEPALYSRSLDSQGRPPQAQAVAQDADWPSLVRAANGTLYLFWLGASDGQVYRAVLDKGTAQNVQTIANNVYLAAGDRLNHFSAGLDTQTGYLFWDITRATGQNETWLTAGALDAANWTQPVRLQVDLSLTAPLQTGFPGGMVKVARPGLTPLAWAAPADGETDMLPVAVQSPTGLGVLFLQRGRIAGYQEVMPGVRLIDAPALHVSSDNNLFLSWAEPASSAARLNVTTTRGG